MRYFSLCKFILIVAFCLFFQMGEFNVALLQKLRQKLCHDYTVVMMKSGPHVAEDFTLLLTGIKAGCVFEEWKLRNWSRANPNISATEHGLLHIIFKIIDHIIEQTDCYMKVVEDSPTRPSSPI